MHLKEVEFDDLSAIRHRIRLGEVDDSTPIAVISFHGICRPGSEGNPDTGRMRAVVMAALEAWEPVYIILDLHDLVYTWGDGMGGVLWAATTDVGGAKVVLVVVSEKCRPALATLSVAMCQPTVEMFGDLNDALSRAEQIHFRKWCSRLVRPLGSGLEPARAVMSQNVSKLVAAYERRVTEESMARARRYMTQCIEEEQVGNAYANIAINKHRRRPFSNSVILHELREADEWHKLGYDFTSPELPNMPYEERVRRYHLCQECNRDNHNPHILATREQYEYLSAVARLNGFLASPGTLMHFSILHGMRDITLVRKALPDMALLPADGPAAEKFMLGRVKREPVWAELALGFCDSGRRMSLLYQKHAEQIRRIVAARKDSYRGRGGPTKR